MKSQYWLGLACLLPLTSIAEVFISEYVEGSGFNKAIELYNPDSTSIELSDYRLRLYQNGNNSAQYTINLSGLLAPYNTYVIAHNDITDKSNVDLLVGNLQHNGDDAIVLEKNNQVIDSIGQVGQDPGNQWGSGLTSTKDNSLVRLANITQGDSNISNAFDPSIEWQGFAKNTLSNLGSHHGSIADNDNPDNDTPDNNHPDNQLCGADYTAIHTIQGQGLTTPLTAEPIWVEGIVTKDLQDSGYKGFYLQSADDQTDSLIETSEGIFVYNDQFQVNTGEHVRLKATPNEYNQLTQLSSVSELVVCQNETTLPNPIVVNLPMTDNERERYEGMLVRFDQSLYVTDTYNYGRYGQLGLASERLFNPTQITSPGAGANELAVINKSKSIIMDDGETAQNPDSLPFPAPELDALNTVRSGDKVTQLTAVMSYSFEQYQLIPLNDIDIEPSNLRAAPPTSNATANVRVVSFNVLNYFNGDGKGNGFPTARGAKNEVEFIRQRDKIMAALAALNADVIGLMEIENDGHGELSAIADLVNGLNDAYGDNVYQFVTPTQTPLGDDAIAVGLIYRQDKISLTQSANLLTSNNSALDDNNQILFLDSKNRPMLVQKFTLLANDTEFVVAVNHLKSKGSDCNNLNDPDLLDGQGNCNQTRTRAANAMGQFLTAHYAQVPTLIIGDLNAYAKEDPILMLANQGYANIFEHLNKSPVYSYIFKGELGQLDHALANQSMIETLVDTHIWPINADEPRVLDYSMQYQNAAQHAKYYSPDAYRSSDHDPVIIDLLLKTSSMLGDFDADQDIDKTDISLFHQKLRARQIDDMRYDFNQDGQLNSQDIRGLMQLCTRPRCAQ